MRKDRLCTTILSLVILMSFCGTAMAQMILFASSTFKSSAVTLNSSGTATFSATATKKCNLIKVDSCTLQIKIGISWVDAKALATPVSATNCYTYQKTKSYGSEMTSGKTYRIKAVFNADGETVTCYSSGMTY